MIELTVYVPKPATSTSIAIKRGSGIVGRPAASWKQDLPRVKIDYEGATHGGFMSWEDKVFHAAGRHLWTGPGNPPSLEARGYPTIARMWVPEDELIPVGIFRCDERWKYTIEITNQEALDAWRS